MYKAFFILLIVALPACTTISTTATQSPDGSRMLEQKITATLGGKLDAGINDFTAEAIGADGSNWLVQSGGQAAGASSPNVFKEFVQAVVQLAPLLAAPVPVPQAQPEADPWQEVGKLIMPR